MMFRSLRKWINQVARLGIDTDRRESVQQSEFAQYMARLEIARTEQHQRQQAIRQRCQMLEQQLLGRLQASQMTDQWDSLLAHLDRQTQKAQLEIKITAAENLLQTVRQISPSLPKAMRTDAADAQLAATIATDKAALTALTQQHQTIAQQINRSFQNVADPQLQPLWLQCCQERDRLGKAGNG
jgi:uncharacterized HAD superfamily protein